MWNADGVNSEDSKLTGEGKGTARMMLITKNKAYINQTCDGRDCAKL